MRAVHSLCLPPEQFVGPEGNRAGCKAVQWQLHFKLRNFVLIEFKQMWKKLAVMNEGES